jgi:glycosyltransferase involved in cell wall biosynthesis
VNTIDISEKIINLNCCVLIPTYNNERTLSRVINGVLKYTNNIIIINDGATDSTQELLKIYSDLEQIHFPINKGKGVALREGFKKAYQLGYSYAITIDSDGQHYPEDLEVFISEIENTPDSLLIGDRNMTQKGIPKKSSFGNKFSNFWYKFETGVKLTDTQSGYRLYPLKDLANLRYFTNKFEFEIEVIVRASWKGITVKNVPIQVLYDESERVSHFRPFKDFTRISVLNTVLVIIALVYIKPRDFLRKLKKKGFKRFFVEDFLQSADSKEKKALSIALGIFIGITPFWGLQTVLVLFLAVVLKLNKLIAFTFSNISLPIFIPFIIYGSIHAGAFLLNMTPAITSISDIDVNNIDIKTHLTQYLLGSFSLAILLALIFGFTGYMILYIFSKRAE